VFDARGLWLVHRHTVTGCARRTPQVQMGGVMSPPSRITLPHEVRRKVNIPLDATHFVWAYQAVDMETLTAEQREQVLTQHHNYGCGGRSRDRKTVESQGNISQF
jgi:hypothetical protein